MACLSPSLSPAGTYESYARVEIVPVEIVEPVSGRPQTPQPPTGSSGPIGASGPNGNQLHIQLSANDVQQVWGTWVSGIAVSFPTWCYSTSCSTTNITTYLTGQEATNVGQWYASNAYYYATSSSITSNTYTAEPEKLLTVEELAAQAERTRIRREEIRVQNEKAEEDRKVAKERAVKILKEHLNEDQLAEFESKDFFHVRGSKSGKLYRITRGTQHNILEIHEDNEAVAEDQKRIIIADLCAHPTIAHAMPTEDTMLAQKIYLESVEDKFLRIANRTKRRDVPARRAA